MKGHEPLIYMNQVHIDSNRARMLGYSENLGFTKESMPSIIHVTNPSDTMRMKFVVSQTYHSHDTEDDYAPDPSELECCRYKATLGNREWTLDIIIGKEDIPEDKPEYAMLDQLLGKNLPF